MTGIRTLKAKRLNRWLALYDRFWMLPPSVLMKTIGYFAVQAKGEDSLSVEFLMSAVPPPAGWDALKRLVLARPAGGRGPSETLLRLTVSYLTGDQAGLTAGVAEMKSAATLRKRDAGFLDRLVRNSPALAAGAASEDRKEDIADRFERYLVSLESERTQGQLTVQVPDLVTAAGEQRAEALIRKALAIPGLSIAVPSGGATLALTKKIVREHAGELLEPQWHLVSTIDDVELYEALERRFPKPSATLATAPDSFVEGSESDQYRYRADDDDRRSAAVNHVLGLVARKQVREAGEGTTPFACLAKRCGSTRAGRRPRCGWRSRG